MKTTFKYFFTALIGVLLIGAIDVFGQTTTDNATITQGSDFHLVLLDTALDSAESAYTQEFKLEGYNGGSSTKLYTSFNCDAADSVNVITSLLGTNFAAVPDSTAYWSTVSAIDTITASTVTSASVTISTHYRWYKFKIDNQDGSKALTYDFGATAPIKED